MNRDLSPACRFDDEKITINEAVTLLNLPALLKVIDLHKLPIREVVFGENVTTVDTSAVVLLIMCRRTISDKLKITGASQKLLTLLHLYQVEPLFNVA